MKKIEQLLRHFSTLLKIISNSIEMFLLQGVSITALDICNPAINLLHHTPLSTLYFSLQGKRFRFTLARWEQKMIFRHPPVSFLISLPA